VAVEAVHAIMEHRCVQVTQVLTKVLAADAVLTTDNQHRDKHKVVTQVQTQVAVEVAEMLVVQVIKPADLELLLYDIKEYEING
jgi:hypothetical protein